MAKRGGEQFVVGKTDKGGQRRTEERQTEVAASDFRLVSEGLMQLLTSNSVSVLSA